MSQPDLDDCAKEPIHIPGSIQPHGYLVALDPRDFTINRMSANLAELLGVEPESVLGRSFLDQITAEARDAVSRLIRDAAASFVNPFRIPVSTPGGKVLFDGIAHNLDEGLSILELEPCATDGTGEGTPTEALDGYLQLIQRSVDRLVDLDRMEEVADLIAREVRQFTGFDRVMVYRFAPDFHGEVIAEDKADGMEPYLGLHYPASDIPAQARELYLKNQVRLLADVDALPVPVVGAEGADDTPLDMSRAVLRSMSPIHLQYLRNMGVAATLTISLVVDGRLWGLIACHHREPRFVSYGIRATSCLYGVVMSSQLELKERTLRDVRTAELKARALALLTKVADFSDIAASFGRSLGEFASLFRADGAAILSDREIVKAGGVPPDECLQGLHAALESGCESGLHTTHRAVFEFPCLSKGLPEGAGLIAIRIGGDSWLVLFRREVEQTVTWAGDPSRAKSKDEAGKLTPRRSFSAWRETVSQQSLPWEDEIVALAPEVRSGVFELVRKRNLALEASNLELRRFAGIMAHEVKNQMQPGIVALALLREREPDGPESPLSQLLDVGSESLESLSRFVTEILDLAQTDHVTETEVVDFAQLAQQAAAQCTAGERADGVEIRIGALPKVRGFRSQLHHLVANLVRNAVTHGKRDGELLVVSIGSESHPEHGPTVFVEDDGMGIEETDAKRVFDFFYRKENSTKRGSGIGLAFCAQIARRHGHRLWVESTPGKGSKFCFTVTPVD